VFAPDRNTICILGETVRVEESEEGFVGMRSLLLLVLAAGCLAAQEKPEYTFGTTVVSTTGLEGRVYFLKKNTARLPQFEQMKPAGTIYTNRLNVWPQAFDAGFPGISGRFEWFAIDYTGRFWIESEGEYRFSLLSDDGARLSIDDAELIDNDGIHAATALSASAWLTRGIHRMRVAYFQGPRFTVALVLSVAAQDGAWRVFNTDEFVPPQDQAEWVKGSIRDVKHSTMYGAEAPNR
jgi:hypothetical protein